MAKIRVAVLNGSLYFFVGIVADVDETKRPKPVKGANLALVPFHLMQFDSLLSCLPHN